MKKVSVIYKYPIKKAQNTYGEFELELPIGCDILSCQDQDGTLTIWVQFEQDIYAFHHRDEVEMELVPFVIVGTGHSLYGDDLEFIATVLQPPFAWHVFRRK